MLTFAPAKKSKLFGRLAIIGPSGSGKTYTALALASAMGQRIAVIDTEHGAASKYADLFSFDVLELTSFDPRLYMQAIRAAESAGYDTIIIDSLSHAWAGSGGILEQVDQITKRSKSGNGYTTGWRDMTPVQNQLIETILASKMHVIATLRSKMEYIQTKDNDGKTVIQKVGLQPIQRDSIEYEFDIILEMDMDNVASIVKTRCPALKGVTVERPGAALAQTITAWLDSGDGERKANPTQFGEMESQIADIEALGHEVYGDEWASKKPQLVRYVSNKTTDDIYKLDSVQLDTLVKGIEEKRDNGHLPPATPKHA